jgi:hypothetical protein
VIELITLNRKLAYGNNLSQAGRNREASRAEEKECKVQRSSEVRKEGT